MDVSGYYRGLHSASLSVLEEAVANTEALAALTAAQNYLADYEKLKQSLKNRPESSLIDIALKEYQRALLALSSGQYRYAYTGLRLFFELMLASVQFSASEIDLRRWRNDTKDVNWNSIKNLETGIFSVNFIKVFSADLPDSGRQFSALAETVYRECSEFVHGNSKTHTYLPIQIKFDEEIFCTWHQKAETMRMVITFAYAARYLEDMTPPEKNLIEAYFLEVIGHLQPIQQAFSK